MKSCRLLIISLFSLSILLYFITSLTLLWTNSHIPTFLSPPPSLPRLVFAISSTHQLWPLHTQYLNVWWKPHPHITGYVFLDHILNLTHSNSNTSTSFPQIRISQDASHFRYTHKHGYRSFVRVARIVSEVVNSNPLSDVHWYVFGGGDTVFVLDNLAKVLSKYDHHSWYYIGTNSEVYDQNQGSSFDMGFWEAGFALSAPLATVLAKVFDSCLERYHFLYGHDGRVYSCLAELGVGLTRESGFHQIDVRGNIFGLLAAHPLTPLVSLPHLTQVDPIFPNMTSITSLQHLFKTAITLDSQRILQQTVCYDRWFSWTISVSWGYAVQIFDHHIYLPDLLRVQDTFSPWKRGGALNYTFTTTPLHPDPCRRPVVLFLERGYTRGKKILTSYTRMVPENCTFDSMNSPRRVEEVVVFSSKSGLGIKQAERRQCCDVLPPSSSSSTHSKMEILIRECKNEELIHM